MLRKIILSIFIFSILTHINVFAENRKFSGSEIDSNKIIIKKNFTYNRKMRDGGRVSVNRVDALHGTWALYGTNLIGDHAWRGHMLVDQHGKVYSGEFENYSDRQKYIVDEGNINLIGPTVTSDLSLSDGTAVRIEGSMNVKQDQIVGILKMETVEMVEGIIILIKTSGNIPVY